MDKRCGVSLFVDSVCFVELGIVARPPRNQSGRDAATHDRRLDPSVFDFHAGNYAIAKDIQATRADSLSADVGSLRILLRSAAFSDVPGARSKFQFFRYVGRRG